ncbi:Uncharacterised protein [Vibrio cholerae]|nr:Uncharacterised protein [Vibrio cholerae]
MISFSYTTPLQIIKKPVYVVLLRKQAHSIPQGKIKI